MPYTTATPLYVFAFTKRERKTLLTCSPLCTSPQVWGLFLKKIFPAGLVPGCASQPRRVQRYRPAAQQFCKHLLHRPMAYFMCALHHSNTQHFPVRPASSSANLPTLRRGRSLLFLASLKRAAESRIPLYNSVHLLLHLAQFGMALFTIWHNNFFGLNSKEISVCQAQKVFPAYPHCIPVFQFPFGAYCPNLFLILHIKNFKIYCYDCNIRSKQLDTVCQRCKHL